MKKSQIKLGAVLSYLQMAANIIIQLGFTPVMLKLLGENEYGLYQTVAATISMLSILNLGFNSGYVRYYAIYKKRNDKEAIQKLNGLFLIIFAIIGAVGLICGLFLSFHLNLVFKEGLTADEYAIARVLMILLSFNLAFTFAMTVFNNIITAHERFIFLKLIAMLKTVCSPLITLPLLLCGFRSITMVTVTVIVSFIADGLYMVYVLFIMKEKFVFHDFEKGFFKTLFVYTAFIAINMIIDQINWNIDKLLLGRFKGTAQVAVYSIGYTLYHCYQLFSTSVSGVFSPRIHSIVTSLHNDEKKERTALTELFIKVGRIQYIILGLIATGIIFFGKYFIVHIWAKKPTMLNAYYVALCLILPATIALIQNLGVEIQRAQNRHQFRSIVYLGMAVINLGVSIVLCQRYGAIGSAAGTAFSLIFANGLIMNIYYYRKCNIDIPAFWKSILRLSVGLIPPVAGGILLMKYVEITSFWMFAVLTAAYTILYALSMWLLAMNKYEKNLVCSAVKAVIRRRANHA